MPSNNDIPQNGGQFFTFRGNQKLSYEFSNGSDQKNEIQIRVFSESVSDLAILRGMGRLKLQTWNCGIDQLTEIVALIEEDISMIEAVSDGTPVPYPTVDQIKMLQQHLWEDSYIVPWEINQNGGQFFTFSGNQKLMCEFSNKWRHDNEIQIRVFSETLLNLATLTECKTKGPRMLQLETWNCGIDQLTEIVALIMTDFHTERKNL